MATILKRIIELMGNYFLWISYVFVRLLILNLQAMKRISLKQRRFLILWCIFHLIALTVNFIPICGSIADTRDSYGNNHHSYIFTNGYYRQDDGTFWPFVKFSDDFNYYGIFYNYSIYAFIVYMTIGFAIVFLPMLWGRNDLIIAEEANWESEENDEIEEVDLTESNEGK
jgi:hypothetical protein